MDQEDYFYPQRGSAQIRTLGRDQVWYAGVILWVCEATREVGLCYIVLRDSAGDSFPDVVFPASIVSHQTVDD